MAKFTPLPWTLQITADKYTSPLNEVEIIGVNRRVVADNVDCYPHAILEKDAELIVAAVRIMQQLVEVYGKGVDLENRYSQLARKAIDAINAHKSEV